MAFDSEDLYRGFADQYLRHLYEIETGRVPRLSLKIKDLVLATLDGARWANSTRLQKMIFLTEVEFIENTGERLSPLEFKSWNFGPYSRTLHDTVYGMMNCIEIIERPNRDIPSARETVLKLRDCRPTGGLDSNRYEFVRFLSKTMRFVKTNTLIKRTKNNDIYKRTPFRETIDLDGYAQRVQRAFERLDKSPNLKSIIQRMDECKSEGEWKTYSNCRTFLDSV